MNSDDTKKFKDNLQGVYGYIDSEVFEKHKKALINLGFESEEREFHPHLTLGRIKRISNTQALTEFIKLNNPNIKGEYLIKRFQLIRSDLRMSGPEYTVLKEFELQ